MIGEVHSAGTSRSILIAEEQKKDCSFQLEDRQNAFARGITINLKPTQHVLPKLHHNLVDMSAV